MDLILKTVKDGLGILPDNLGFDNELLIHVNSVAGDLFQIGVDEMDIIVTENTEWPAISDSLVLSLAKQYMVLAVRVIFDPIASETIVKMFEQRKIEVGGRITSQVEAANA